MRKPRIIRLSDTRSGTVRFLSGLHVTLEEGKTTSWVTVTRTGVFRDPRYGEFEISRQMLGQMVENFNTRAFGQDIFYDVAHKPADGAAGKVLQLRLEGDRLRAQVEWTPYGIDAIKSKGYTYSSIEYHDNYQDNETGRKYGPVMMGAALVTRPCVKRLDPIQLSEFSEEFPTLIHPELQSTLLQEIHVMHKKLAEQLKALLAGIVALSEPMRVQLLSAFETAVQPTTDEVKAKQLMEAFAESGKKLGEQLDGNTAKDIKLSIEVPNLSAGLTADDVKKLMADEAARKADEVRKLNDLRTGNIKLLTDTINTATGLDETTRKELTDAVTDLVTAEMSADQVKKLAELQIGQGNKIAAAKKLSSMGFQWPAGNVHITVDSGNEIKSLQEEVDKRLYDGMPAYKRYALSGGAVIGDNKKIVEESLRVYDSQNGVRLHNEYRAHKQLAGGDSLVSDVAIPAIFERTVIREALYQLVGLGLCDVGTAAFSAVVQLPYSYRDTSAAGVSAARKYEGQSIARAAVKQAMEEARPIPQKLAFEVSDELRYLVGNGQINFDIVAENARNAARIIGEDTEILLFNEHLDAADQYSAVNVTNEAVATGNGTNKIFVLDNFPVVRPKKIYDLQGAQVGSTLYPVTIKLNGATISEWAAGVGAGTYYTINYNLGEITFVDQTGAAIAAPNTQAIVASYTYTTNVHKWDSDLGAIKVDEKYDDFLYRFGLRKAVIEDRAYMPNVGIMSGMLRTQIEQARQFGANFKRSGTDLMADGNLGRIKDVPSFRSYAPGLAMGDVRTVLCERGTVRFRMLKPWTLGELENQKDSNGRFTGKKEAYGDQFVIVHTPTQLKGAFTSIVVYSSSGRVDRAA